MANGRTIIAILHDIIAIMIAWIAAFWLRFNLDLPEPYHPQVLYPLIWITPLYTALFIGSGLYRGIWRYASLLDLRRIILFVAIGALSVTAICFMFRIPIPRSVLVMSPLLLVMMMGGSRLSYRGWKEHQIGRTFSARESVVVFGATETAASLVKELAHSPQWRVVGVFEDNGVNHRSQIHGVTVYGTSDKLPEIKLQLNVQRAIIAMPDSNHRARRLAVEKARAAGLQVLTVPSFEDLMSGKVTISQIRNIELDDLLGRDPIVLDTAGLNGWISNHVVLVTGAGGSIGSELCRQIATYHPHRLILLELNELALYNIEQEFTERFPDTHIVCVICDVKNPSRVDELMKIHRPSVVFHAAAYKHVPLMETHNAWQAVLNNALGTRTLAQAAIASGVEKFVVISTDKAVNPTNVMGASKRLAEMACQSLQQDSGTQFVMVRFGNVLGSTGSVIPKFRDQIAKGGPVTVTHPEITRYFMSIPEAVQLVLQAGLIGKGGEILVLDMGDPVRIADLARELIRLSGYKEDEIRIAFTGLRPGEKLYEELLADDEHTLPTPHPKLRVAQARREDTHWLNQVNEWLDTNTDTGDAAVKTALAQFVPEYSPQHSHDL